MTSNLDKSSRSRGDTARARAYLKDFLPGMVAYCLVLTAVVRLGDLGGSSHWRFLWALLPVIPILWVVRAVARHLGRIDEYQQHQGLQGIGISFAATMIAAIGAGLLGIAGLNMRFAGLLVFGVGMMTWVIAASTLAARR